MSDIKRPTGGKGLVTMRVSDDRQSMIEQKAIIEKWLGDFGLTDNVVEWFSDVGSRLEAYKRAAFLAMLKRVERGDIRWIVVECLDRFGVRSVAELGKFICHLQDHDVKLYCISENLEATSDDAFVTLSTAISGLRSNDELRSRAHRALKGRAARFRDNEHGGGPPPYSFATCCYDRLGVEIWRLEIVGCEQRLQLFPDGRRVEFNGKRNTPAKNLAETLRVVPSIHTERQEWVRWIFNAYVNLDCSYKNIATNLNNLKVDALNGKGWSGPRIKLLLENPCYVVGAVVGNKSGRGKVLGLVGGKEQPVQRVGGKTGRVTKRDTSDFIYPTGEYEAIISQEVWQLATNKTKAKTSGTRGKAPRNPHAWLSGLLICGGEHGCGCKMAVFHKKHARDKYSYTCSSRRAYGAAAKCKLNRVPHRVISELVERYLGEAGVKLTMIANTQNPTETLRALQMVTWSRQREFLGTLAEMVEVLHEAGIETGMEIDGQHYETVNLKAEYAKVHQARQADLAKTITEKEEELRGFLRTIPRMSSDLAIRMAEEEVERLGREIEELKRQAQPLGERAEWLLQAIRKAQERVREAREALGGPDGPQKSEAVRRVVRAIECHFVPVDNPGVGEPTSRLVRVVVQPLEGDDWVVPEEMVASRRSARHHLLSRTFDACEIAEIIRG